ncbi:MAG: FlgO family outer membrane protein [bacterium]|nr:FlgO family outer membrane protein [bacterium]
MKNFKIYIFLFFILGSAGCAGQKSAVKTEEEDASLLIARMVIRNQEKLPNRSLAVIEFSHINGNPVPEGRLLAERIITRLAQYKEIKVVERNKVNKVLEEQNLSLSGLTDSAIMKKIGKILNVDALLTGTLAPVDGYTEINARMIHTETALVLCAIRVKEKGLSSGTSGPGKPVQGVVETGNPPAGRMPRVDVQEFRVEKNKEGLGKGYGTVKIIGKGIYIPSDEEPLPFKDLTWVPVFNLLDRDGNKITEFKGGFKYGEYGNEENIKPQKPFPFTGEDGLVKKEFWDKVASCEFVKWGYVK